MGDRLVTKITGLPTTRAIVDSNGVLTQEARSYFRVLTARTTVVGTGSPEGVVEADQATLYMDDAGASGNVLYVKRSDEVAGNRANGWVLV